MDVMFGKEILTNTEWKAGTVRSNADGTRIVMGVEDEYSGDMKALVLESDVYFRFFLLELDEEDIVVKYPIVIKGSRIVLGGINV